MQTETTSRPYDPALIEPKWQAHWEATKAHEVRDDLPREQCYYVLEMFPYPSGKLHMGHVRNYSIGDAVAHTGDVDDGGAITVSCGHAGDSDRTPPTMRRGRAAFDN